MMLPTAKIVGINTNMKATRILNDRRQISDNMFAQMVIWHVPAPLKGSEHQFKYRLAFVVDGVCVMRYDNEAGKGDHRHYGAREEPYIFTTLETLLEDFQADIIRLTQESER